MGFTNYARLRFKDTDEQFSRQGEDMGPFILKVRWHAQCLSWTLTHCNHGLPRDIASPIEPDQKQYK